MAQRSLMGSPLMQSKASSTKAISTAARTAAAAAGFLVWNFYPAKVFMGDTDVYKRQNYYQAFGLTQTTGIDLPYEAKGISKTQQEMEQVETDLYSTAFGQSQKLTLIQMAAAVASTVNGGYLMTCLLYTSR